MGRKSTECIFKATDWRNLTLEDLDKNWNGNLKKETEYLLIAAQNNATKTIYIKTKIDDTVVYQDLECSVY